jgi:ubiquinone/menaquinone biosynthesis C-methylase UbiE
MAPLDPDQQRAGSRDAWEVAAGGWGRRADRIREWGMAVSVAMVDALDLQPGERVLELAAGPGDTGFMAAEIVRPGGGTLLASDGAEAMLDVARRRAAQAGIDNVEFRQLELEWIDLPTAGIDAVLCRWGIMLIVDPDAAAHEIRRVLRAGGRAALAVWDDQQHNPWATIPNAAMIKLGYAQPPDPEAPGMFSLAAEGALRELLQNAGFTDVEVEPVAVERAYDAIEEYVAETAEMSPNFSATFAGLTGAEQAEVAAAIGAAAAPFIAPDGSVRLPGSSLVARAIA